MGESCLLICRDCPASTLASSGRAAQSKWSWGLLKPRRSIFDVKLQVKGIEWSQGVFWRATVQVARASEANQKVGQKPQSVQHEASFTTDIPNHMYLIQLSDSGKDRKRI